ncbi:MAG: neutral/alkaline non-lysosomal ceramidase N-terminal domain-containing protein [Cyclobacteriaceae bacterium]|jgi:neutral ceramidase|nr:neutral/alkaline non-lysosomal ceramidase N-terminal domain-containing protein [Cyclobacteriaceae bacterium]
MKRWLKGLLAAGVVIILILFSLVGKIDRTQLPDQQFYQQMTKTLSNLQPTLHPASQPLRAGWGKVSITPSYPMPMAGYRMRPTFDAVHDSLYARIIGINNGSISCYFISLDLLLFPPAIKEILQKKLVKEFSEMPFLYLSATHTHNGIGGWHNSIVGELVLGNYDEAWVNNVADDLVVKIKQIEKSMKPAQMSYWEADASEYAENRLVPGAPYDGFLRGIQLLREDSSQAQLITYSAHATSISKKSKSLSGDYPATLIKKLERENSFGLFMAGMVGSHRLAGLKEQEFELVEKAGEVLYQKIKNTTYDQLLDSIEIKSAHIPIQFGPAQLRITKNIKLRNWAFSWLLNPLQGELTFLQLGNLIFIGTPCDFSGEIYVNKKLNDLAMASEKKLIITSFNGNYAGYITEDEHYDKINKEEVMALNWVGPYYGNYFSEMISTLIKK